MRHQKTPKRATILISSLCFLTIALSGCDMDMGSWNWPTVPKANATVVITWPPADTTLSGEVDVQVTVTNATASYSSAADVFLWVDGNMNNGSVIFPSVDWFTTETTNGPHKLQAEVDIYQNGVDNFFWSTPVTVNVRN
jgi:hypothetical protein